MVCSFSEQGTFIFAGSNDCCVYVWHWDLDPEHWRKCGSAASALFTRDNNQCIDLSLPPQELDSLRYADATLV